jgi:hypothetical protein
VSDRLASSCTDETWQGIVVNSIGEFLEATRERTTVSFVDEAALSTIASANHVPVSGPIIAICQGTLQSAIGWLARPWIAHVVNTAMLNHPMADDHLSSLLAMLADENSPKLREWIGASAAGRRVRLTQAHRRIERLDRMTEFFASQGVGVRSVEHLRDIAEELLTNAFYDAPVAAGAVKRAISRTLDVTLPGDCACELIYACRDDLAIIRVRDPFGALTRARFMEVLTRCARTDMKVRVDETMGGAGLGLWRIFSTASFVAVSVVAHRHTEFLVGIVKRGAAATRPFAFHLFFRESGLRARAWRTYDEDASEPSVNRSVTLLPDEGAGNP